MPEETSSVEGNFKSWPLWEICISGKALRDKKLLQKFSSNIGKTCFFKKWSFQKWIEIQLSWSGCAISLLCMNNSKISHFSTKAWDQILSTFIQLLAEILSCMSTNILRISSLRWLKRISESYQRQAIGFTKINLMKHSNLLANSWKR